MRIAAHLAPGLDPEPLVVDADGTDRIVDRLTGIGARDRSRPVAYLRGESGAVAAMLGVDPGNDRGVLHIEQPDLYEPAAGDVPPAPDRDYRDTDGSVHFPGAWERPLSDIRAALRQLAAGQIPPPAIDWAEQPAEALAENLVPPDPRLP